MDFSNLDWQPIVTYIGGAFTLLLPLFVKMLHSKSFRKELSLGFKKLLRMFTGKDLLSHYIFLTGKRYIEIAKDIRFEDSCEKKNDLFRALLVTKIDTVLKESFTFVEALLQSRNKLNTVYLEVSFRQFIRKTVAIYEKRILEAFFKMCRKDKEAQELYNIVYLGRTPDGTKTDGIGFKTYHQRNIDHITLFLEDLNTYIGLTDRELIFAFLSEVDTALRTSVRDTKRVFQEKNGRICKIME